MNRAELLWKKLLRELHNLSEFQANVHQSHYFLTLKITVSNQVRKKTQKHKNTNLRKNLTL